MFFHIFVGLILLNVCYCDIIFLVRQW